MLIFVLVSYYYESSDGLYVQNKVQYVILFVTVVDSISHMGNIIIIILYVSYHHNIITPSEVSHLRLRVISIICQHRIGYLLDNDSVYSIYVIPAVYLLEYNLSFFSFGTHTKIMKLFMVNINDFIPEHLVL